MFAFLTSPLRVAVRVRNCERGDGRPMSVGGFDSPNSRGDLAVV